MTPESLAFVAVIVAVVGGLSNMFWQNRMNTKTLKDLRTKHEEALVEKEKKHETDMERLAVRVCREFLSSKEYQHARDDRTNELIDYAFAKRSSSFVDRMEFAKHEEEMIRRFNRLDDGLIKMSKVVGELDGKISTTVANQVAAQLMPILTQKIIHGGGGPFDPDATGVKKR